jgi:hypothetical protein
MRVWTQADGSGSKSACGGLPGFPPRSGGYLWGGSVGRSHGACTPTSSAAHSQMLRRIEVRVCGFTLGPGPARAVDWEFGCDIYIYIEREREGEIRKDEHGLARTSNGLASTRTGCSSLMHPIMLDEAMPTPSHV